MRAIDINPIVIARDVEPTFRGHLPCRGLRAAPLVYLRPVGLPSVLSLYSLGLSVNQTAIRNFNGKPEFQILGNIRWKYAKKWKWGIWGPIVLSPCTSNSRLKKAWNKKISIVLNSRFRAKIGQQLWLLRRPGNMNHGFGWLSFMEKGIFLS